MFVDEIALKDFRSYEKGFVSFENGVNIIYGGNARGKTNILEAIFLLSYARSHRCAREGEMIRHGSSHAKVSAKFSSKGRSHTGEIILFADKKKQIKINKIPIDKTSELMGYLSVVMFCPEDLRLVKGSPRERRRMMDLCICQISKRYLNTLSGYLKILEQRNKLLKCNPDSNSLWVWDEKLAMHGSEVICLRKKFIDQINVYAARAHYEISGEKLEISYKCGAGVESFSSIDSIKEQFLKELSKVAEREKRFGISLAGPHRDDFEIFINSKEAKAFASQGQQRTAALSLKLAEVLLIKDTKKESPVLLLDDVLSELDGKRQSYIMQNISGMQVIITCTDLPQFGKAKIINVEDVRR